jgi:hypothetical protein
VASTLSGNRFQALAPARVGVNERRGIRRIWYPLPFVVCSPTLPFPTVFRRLWDVEGGWAGASEKRGKISPYSERYWSVEGIDRFYGLIY